MPNRSLKDINVIAADIVAQATGSENPTKTGKNPHAVALGRRGGAKGGKARAKKLTKQQRVEAAKRAAKARWEGSER